MLFIHDPNFRQKVFGLLLLILAISLIAIYYHLMEVNWKSFNFWFTHFMLLIILFQALLLLFTKSRLPPPLLPNPDQWQSPNNVPLSTRVINTLGSFALLAWGSYGLYQGDIPMPARKGEVAHFTGLATWILYGAILCAVVNLMAEVVDHYDRRNNELLYAHIAAATQWIGWALFIVASIRGLFQGVA